MNNTPIPLEQLPLPGAIRLHWQHEGAKLCIDYHQQHLVLEAEVKKDLRKITAQQIAAAHPQPVNRIIVSTYINPIIRALFQNAGIAYLDATGSLFVQTPAIFILLEGKDTAPKATAAPKERAFAKTGLPIVLDILQNAQWLQQPYRELAAAYGIALGNLTHIVTSLQQMQFLVKMGNTKSRQYTLRNKKQLFEKWVAAYEQVLQPKLHLGNFRPLNKDALANWQQWPLPGKTVWGGEPAAALLTHHYLQPGLFTAYTDDKKALVKEWKLVPDEKGPVQLYQHFWKNDLPGSLPVAPALLVYADLINTGDARNAEAAQMIYDEHIKAQLD